MAISQSMPTSFKVGLLNGNYQFPAATGATFTGVTSGTTLTVSSVSGTIYIGMGVTTTAAPNTLLGYVTAFGTGTGGNGTYTLSASSSVSSTAMNAGGYYIALYTNTTSVPGDTSLTAATTQYTAPSNPTNTPLTNTGEVTSTGTAYTTGGKLLTVSLAPTSASGTTAYIDFDDVTWSSATITARGALIYRLASYGGVTNPAVAVLDFGSDKSSSASNFTIQFPAVGTNGSTAILRIE
jgi:hypothetical protein